MLEKYPAFVRPEVRRLHLFEGKEGFAMVFLLSSSFLLSYVVSGLKLFLQNLCLNAAHQFFDDFVSLQ